MIPHSFANAKQDPRKNGMAKEKRRERHRPHKDQVVVFAGQHRPISLDEQEGGEPIDSLDLTDQELSEIDSSETTQRLDQIFTR